MYLYRNETTDTTVVIGEKEIYRNVMGDMDKRGFKRLGSFNAGWDGFSPSFILIWDSKLYDKFIANHDMTVQAELDDVKKDLAKLKKQINKLL